jgi:pyroglutamyl-peptidase
VEEHVKLLLTGFEPFGKQTINPSEVVVRRLSNSRIPGVELATSILAVHPQSGPEKLLRTFSEVRPDAVLLLGEGGGYAVPFIERIFVNLLEYPASYGGGVGLQDQPVNPTGPSAYFATIPVRAMSEELVKAGLPCQLSLSAGTYLCNQVGYVILDHINRQGLRVPAGFIHLPFLPEQAAKMSPVSAIASMEVETLCRTVSVAIETIVKRPLRMV